MKIAVAQMHSVPGDLAGNAEKILAITESYQSQADLILFPELALPGYGAKDLFLSPDFLREQQRLLDKIQARSEQASILVGALSQDDNGELYNSAYLFERCGNGPRVYSKQRLARQDVFYEPRFFSEGTGLLTFSCPDGVLAGVVICEDLFAHKEGSRAGKNPVEAYAQAGVGRLFALSASPYEEGKPLWREQLFADLTERYGVELIQCNTTGGTQGVVFDGISSFIAKGQVLQRLDFAREQTVIVNLEKKERVPLSPLSSSTIEHKEAILCAGLRDFIMDLGAKNVMMGLSGGVDSALALAIAVQALGAEHVSAVLLPSKYSSDSSVTDAVELAENLGVQTKTLSIKDPHLACFNLCRPFDESYAEGALWDQNIQARLRGLLLMALSNQSGALLINTTNKSEMALGFGTLYGDMCGALALLADLYKGEVYEMCRLINSRAGKKVIPESILIKSPSAELRPDQADSDTLPPYPVVDKVLREFLGRSTPAAKLASVTGEDKATIARILSLYAKCEFKRYQSAPVIKLTPRPFGEGRVYPVVFRAPFYAEEAL